MGDKRIIAHFMHEDELTNSQNLMKQVEERTDGYVLGSIDENEKKFSLPDFKACLIRKNKVISYKL